MVAWLTVVGLLFARFIGMQLRFRARIRHAAPVDLSSLAIDAAELCRRCGVVETTAIVEHDLVAVPSICGITRPTIILPRGIASILTAQQLRWALIHELVHVRRRDLIFVAFERAAVILHFFNPAIWIATRAINQLREYACDDLALSLSDSSAVDPGEAFVRILQHGNRRRNAIEGALGIFGSGSRSACFRRLRRLLDSERPIRTAPGALSMCGLVLLAVLSVPTLRAGAPTSATDLQESVNRSATGSQRDQQSEFKAQRDHATQEFELLVVGPSAKPIQDAVVEIATTPLPMAAQVRKGKFVGAKAYVARVTTNADGRLAVAIPRAPDHFNVYITIPGFGPYWAGWSSESHRQTVPSRLTAELDPAWSVGGIIVDATGKPIEGVEIGFNIEFKKRPDEVQQLFSGSRVKTDSAGKWHFDSVPVSMGEVHVNFDHPSYMPVRRALSRREFGIEAGRQPAVKIIMDRGLTVTGKITDEAGKLIAGALVRTQFWNEVREAKTGADGVYTLIGCEPKAVHLVVSARGRATDMKELNIEPGMAPVDFKMKPGGTVRIRVLDERGNPVPKARIFFQRWRGGFAYFEFGNVNQYADANGVWVWNEAPLDRFEADICPPGGTTLPRQPLIARPEEYVFRVPGPLVVSGIVTDAATKKPIKAFGVIPGGRQSDGRTFWNRKEAFAATNGQYEIRRTRGEPTNLIRIEADGYQAAVSRVIKSDEGKISIDFALKPGPNIAGKVVTPRNDPAAGAKVALGLPESQICVQNGDIDDSSTVCARADTDESGRFHFAAQDQDFQLVITHPSGFALVKSTRDWELTRIIHLEPWCRVEGTFKIGKSPAANVPLEVDVPRMNLFGQGEPKVFAQHRSTTGPDGQFVFERVIPGTGRIGRRITFMVNEGATEVTSAYMVPAEFPAGKTVHFDLGGTGRAVVGRLQPSERFLGEVRWNFAEITVQSVATDPHSISPYFTATVDRDGRFRIDDVPPGEYSLRVDFMRDNAGHLRNCRFTVPPIDGASASQPVDLPVLTLEKP
jgi:protocatechuate 3,4-dioxygenase beta subunit